jgi:hypothetical protein
LSSDFVHSKRGAFHGIEKEARIAYLFSHHFFPGGSMARPVTLFAVLFFLPAFALAQQVTFTMKAPDAGVSRSVVDSMDLVALISVNAEGMDQTFEMSQGERSEYSEAVLATDGDVVRRKRIAVTEAVERTSQPMQPASVKNAPTVGKSYIMEFLADSIAVTTEDGATVPDDERKYIVKKFSRDRESQFGEVLNGRTMTVGEVLELKDELLKAFGKNMSQGSMDVRSAKLTLNGIGKTQGMKTALLGVDVVMGGAQGPMEMEITLTGTAEIGVDNLWPLSLVMSGTLTGAGNHGGADLSADGDMKVARIATYE